MTEGAIDAFSLVDTTCDMSLAAMPPVADLGDAVSLTTWKGKPGGPVIIVLTGVDGAPFTLVIAVGAFDGNGDFQLVGAVPNLPDLSGVEFEFVSYGTDVDDAVVQTNFATLSIQ